MALSTPLVLDARSSAWREFIDALGNVAELARRDGAFAYVRPPRRCAREAARVVHALHLEDHVHLLAPDEPLPDDCPPPDATGGGPVFAGIAEAVDEERRGAPARTAV